MNKNPNTINPKEVKGDIDDWRKVRIAISMYRTLKENDQYSDPENVIEIDTNE